MRLRVPMVGVKLGTPKLRRPPGVNVLWNLRTAKDYRRQFEEVLEVVRADLAALGERISTLDVGISQTTATEPQNNYNRAAASHARAERALSAAEASHAAEVSRGPLELARMSAALEEGHWAAASCRTRLDGKPPPERTPPCFFDPRHGPSRHAISWAPADGDSRQVPACELCFVLTQDGLEPAARRVPVNGDQVPYYNSPRQYHGWAIGYYSAVDQATTEKMFAGLALKKSVGFVNKFARGRGGGHVESGAGEIVDGIMTILDGL